MKLNKYGITLTPSEKRKYLLPIERDYEILAKIKKLEKLKLLKEDRFMAAFIKTQLERDWRTPLIKELDKIAKKY